MLDISNVVVSEFSNIMEIDLPNQNLLSDVLDEIKNPSKEMVSIIKKIRNETDKNKRDELKVKLLPVICFSGTFSKREDKGIISFNPIICLDLDDISDIDAERERLKTYPYVYAFFTSPTGKGLKVLVYHDLPDYNQHKNLYCALGDDMKLTGRGDLTFDLHCSNVSRACFLSADSKMYLNRNATQYHFIPLIKPVVMKDLDDTMDIIFPETPLSDYYEMRRQIQDTHSLFEEHYNMFPGCRNKNLYILSRFFRLDGIPEEIASDYLVSYYRDNQNGFTAAEIRKTVESAYK